MNLPSKQKQTHRRRDQTCGCQVGGEEGAGQTGSLGPVGLTRRGSAGNDGSVWEDI